MIAANIGVKQQFNCFVNNSENGKMKVSMQLFATCTALGSLLISVIALYLQLSHNKILYARGLVVSDSQGVDRVIIGAPLPGPSINGVTRSRAGKLSGILINGPDGTERGAYGTVDESGEALLTLDSQDGKVEQFKVVSNPKSGASIFITSGDGVKSLMLSTYTGEPRITKLIDGKEVAHYPVAGK